MLYHEPTPDTFTPWDGKALPNGILPPGDIRSRDPAYQATFGLYEPVRPSVPEGKQVVSESVQRIEGVVTYVYELEDVPPPTVQDVHDERNRRLALGFDYDFGDARGVHHFKTTPADMEGWDEVSKLAQAQINLMALDPDYEPPPIPISTGTGFTQVTPVEWQSVLLAAAAFRQPIWAASFVLEAMDPIPADYADDSYWP